jgi:hypothetical protein
LSASLKSQTSGLWYVLEAIAMTANSAKRMELSGWNEEKTCTNRKSLLQTSSNHVAPIKTLIECLDSTATSRPFTIPKKVGIQPLKSLQVTHISAMPLPSTSWHLWNWSRSAPAAARGEE